MGIRLIQAILTSIQNYYSGDSNECPHSLFQDKNKKNNVYPYQSYTNGCLIGSELHGHVSMMFRYRQR